MVDEARLDPWGITDIKDYSRLFDEFGIEPIEPLLDRIRDLSPLIRRGAIFGHRDLGRILEAADKGESYAVMSGIKPTGPLHLGSKMTVEEIIFFQKMAPTGVAFYGIADVEAFCDNGLPFSETAEIAVDNLADLLALGLDRERCYVWKQSEEIRVMDLASIFSRGVTYSMMKAIYGERHFGLYFSALIQAGDILLPQLEDFGGPKPVLVPVGADQDPHLRLTRDLAKKFNPDFGFILPSAVYHKLTRSLAGDYKMSKRDPMNLLTLSDDPKLAREKIMQAYTGGRATIEIQRRLGGEADRCPVYELYLYHFVEDDERVRNVYQTCVEGGRLCGECKIEIADIVAEYLERHQERKEGMKPLARDLLKECKKSIWKRLERGWR